MSARQLLVSVKMTRTEAEALTLFLAERAELCNRHSLDFGVKKPLRLPAALADGYRKALTATVEGLAS